jgi:hypothetical protein
LEVEERREVPNQRSKLYVERLVKEIVSRVSKAMTKQVE